MAEPLEGERVRYRFELREELLFQDDPCFEKFAGKGRAITSRDLAFQLMRVADPAVNSPAMEPFSNVLGFTEFGARLKERREDADAEREAF